jgi:hypothetical protein
MVICAWAEKQVSQVRHAMNIVVFIFDGGLISFRIIKVKKQADNSVSNPIQVRSSVVKETVM